MFTVLVVALSVVAAVPVGGGVPVGVPTSADVAPAPLPYGAELRLPRVLPGDPDVAAAFPTAAGPLAVEVATRPIAWRDLAGRWQAVSDLPVVWDPEGPRILTVDPRLVARFGTGLIEEAVAAVQSPGFEVVVARHPTSLPTGAVVDGISALYPSGCRGGEAGVADRLGVVAHLTEDGDGVVGGSIASEVDIGICPRLSATRARLAIAHELAHGAGLAHAEDPCALMAARLAPRCQRLDDPDVATALAHLYPPDPARDGASRLPAA